MKRLNESNLAEVARIEKESIECPWSFAVLEREIDNPDFVVLEIDDKVIGYGSYYVTAGEANVNNIAVDLPFRGNGYSKLILTDLIAKAKSEGLSAMTLEVSEKNDVAINLYKSFGFMVEGKRKDYYPDGAAALIMWLRF